MLIKFDFSSKTGILDVKFAFATANLKIETLRMRRRFARVFKPRSRTFETKESRAGLVRVPLFGKYHCATSGPAKFTPYQVTGFCKGPIGHREEIGKLKYRD